MDEKGEPGLHLTDKTVHRISGPISMYYLKPKASKTFRGDRENLPLVLLWGDHHKDDQEMCKDCSCSDSKDCCYNIYDREFLKELDKLAANYPVDFYTELSADMPTIGTVNNPKNILFHRFLSQTTIGCHRKEERSTPQYKNSCPTENIRWHYSDPRFMVHSMENFAFRFPKLIIIYKTLPVLKILDDSLTVTENSKAKQQSEDDDYDKIQAKIVKTIVQCHEELFVAKYIARPGPDSKNYPTYQAGWALFLDIAEHMTSMNNSVKNLVSLYVDSMIKNGKYSVIYKQLIKFSPDITRNTIVDLFSGIICRTSPNVSSHLVTIQNLVKQQPRVRSFLNDFFQPDYVSGKKYLSFQGITKTEVSLFRRGIELLSGLLFEFSIIFVELYTLFRMLKPPAGSSSPFLVMGFYGATHTRNMVAILQDVTLFSYEVVYEKRYRNAGDSAIPPDYRCVAIDTPINLARDLEERAQAILAHPAHRSAYENYQRVIQAEQMGREPAASLIPAPPVASNAPIPVQNAPKKTFKIRKSRRAPNVALPAIPNAPVSLPVPVPNAPKKTSKVRKPRRAPNAPVSLPNAPAAPALSNAPVSLPVPVPNAPKKTFKVRKPRRDPNAPAAPALSNAPVSLPVPVPNAPKKTFKIRKSRRAPNAALPAAPASSSTIAP